MEIQYCTDAQGRKTAVIIPFADWENINSRYETLQNKVRILTGIQDGLQEVKTARRKGKKLQSLSDFINESRS